jgi:hypothetical protein
LALDKIDKNMGNNRMDHAADIVCRFDGADPRLHLEFT